MKRSGKNERKKKKKLVRGFTCGSFDLTHAGHAEMFRECKEKCDYLIVGLQSDPTFDRPHKNRPVQTLEERHAMLSAVKYIDEIVVYHTEADLLKLLQTLPIDVRVIGLDWKGKQYTGNHLPIKVYFNSRGHGRSTSELRRRVYEAEKKRLEGGSAKEGIRGSGAPPV